MPQGRIRGRRIALAVAASVLGALAIAPAAALAAPPTPNTCTQVGATGAGGETDWACYADPSSVAGYEVEQTALGNIPKPPVDGHITHMEVDVVDAATANPVPISRLMLHHIVFFNASKTDAACGGPERFYGAGEERAKISFPDGYGYPTTASPTNNWFMVYMFMNHRAQTDDALIEYKVTVAPPSAALTSVRSYWLDVGNCEADPIYNVPGIEQLAAKKCKKAGKNAKPGARKKASRCRKAAKKQAAAAPTEATDVRTKDVAVKEDGWIVAGAGHVHGGAKELNVTKPGCNNLEVAQSLPTWGNADHPFYNVKPILHEPGPIGMSAFGSEDGVPVTQGQTIRLNSLYDNLQPHTRVMGIFVVYVAPDPAGGPDPDDSPCGGAPADTVYLPGTPPGASGRTTPVPFTVPLTGLDSSGTAVEIDGPPGAFKTLSSGATVTVGDRFFSEPNVIVKPGATINYSFAGNEAHNLTLANGPLGIGSPNMAVGSYQQTFNRPGTYRFFCGLHPVQMSERVVVKSPTKKKKKKKSTRKKR